MRSPPAQGLDVLWSSSISHPTGLLPAEQEVGGVEGSLSTSFQQEDVEK